MRGIIREKEAAKELIHYENNKDIQLIGGSRFTGGRNYCHDQPRRGKGSADVSAWLTAPVPQENMPLPLVPP